MPAKNDEVEYHSLLSYSESEANHRAGGTRTKPRSKSHKHTILIGVALALFLGTDIVIFMSVAHLIIDVTRTVKNQATMEFRNPYIGLDELYALKKVKPSQYKTLINEPRLAAQVSQVEPDKVFPIDAHRWLSDFGVLSPPDRHLHVNPYIHTIAQFNVLDYGMEQCALAFRLPKRGESLPHPYTLPAGETVGFDICQLDAPRPLDETEITWATRPECVKKLGTITARVGGETEMEPFFCKSGSFVAYEISCSTATPDCNIETWTNHNETWGFFIKQYQSVV